MNPPAGAYRLVGVLCLAVSLPSWALLVRGSLFASRDPFLLLPFLGTMPGILLLAFGTGRLQVSTLSHGGLRVAGIGLALVVCLLGSWVGMRLGLEALRTAVRFCAMAASYLGLLSLGLLVTALVRSRRVPTGDSPEPGSGSSSA